MRALVLGACLIVAVACSRTQPPETSRPASDTTMSPLALYDLAGFPTITGRRLVERRVEFDRGQPLCERGVLFEHRGHPAFLTIDLQLRHGVEPFESIPAALRRSIPREPLFGRHVKANVLGGPARIERMIDTELPVTVLARPRMGVDDRRPTPCRTTEEGRHLDPAAQRLDLFVRAQWAQMRGLAELARALQGRVGADDPDQQRRLRSDLASVLVAEAERAMLGWQPRDEVAHLLRRAAAIAPEPRRSRILADVRDVAETMSPPTGHDPHDWLAEQAMHPGGLPHLPVGIASLLTWQPEQHLRDPIAEVLQSGMPGARHLVARLGDATWTRASCNGKPCRVGELVREGLGRFAMRAFATNDQARAWWSSVAHMTEREFLRAALHEPEWLEASARLTRLVGPEVIEDLAALRGTKPVEEIVAAIAHAVRHFEVEVIADPELRTRYARVLREIDDASRPGWSPHALAVLLDIEPARALDRLVARCARPNRCVEDRDESLDDTDFSWSTAFEVGLQTRHRPMMRLFARALRLPERVPLSASAWRVVDDACSPEDEPPVVACSSTMRRMASRYARRHLDREH